MIEPKYPNQTSTATALSRLPLQIETAKQFPQKNKKNKNKDEAKPTLKTMRLAFLLTLLAAAIAADSATAVATTIYQLLAQHGLPTGILPKGIMEYTADPATGFFEVRLARPCNAEFENQLHYDFNVSGQLSFGKIGELSGVSQQELFLWFPVKGIRVDVPSSGLIYFDVGVVDKQFSLSLFESPRDCTAADPDDGRSADTSSFNDASQNQRINLGFKNGQRGTLRAVS